jgi:hypothetical protein
MADTKKPMVGWFDPTQLIQTSLRVLISTIFGQFADKREALAAANPITDTALDPHFDYSAREGDFWFDYIADTGDGWNPTFAIARLLAQDTVALDGLSEPMPRGALLILGGDEVYPTASREEYGNRLLYPFKEAHNPTGGTPLWPADRRPDLYALPGNHDWYDGLRSFFHLFCRRTVKQPGMTGVVDAGRVIGGRQTQQTRSYFALKLPQGWWLWGTDSQLEGTIDQPQIDFFKFVAERWMEPGSKLILCTGTPDWEYAGPATAEKGFASFSYLSRLAGTARKGHKLKLVLSGDSHHYARFTEEGLNHITCGGGGAFLHPTHHLDPKPFDFAYPRPGDTRGPAHGPYRRGFEIARKAGSEEEALFPSRADSRKLAAGNLLFALRNAKFTFTLGAIYLFFAWLLDFNARALGDLSLPEMLAGKALPASLLDYGRLILSSPWTTLLCALAWAGYFYFAELTGWRRALLGTVHWALQALVIVASGWTVAQAPLATWAGDFILPVWLLGTAALSALASATLTGLYLWFCLSAFGIHWGHFSSLTVEDYKSFLRLRIDSEGQLHIHPVGLRHVPNDMRRAPGDPPEALTPELIEPPIVIR